MGKDFREYRREQIDRDPGYADVVAETQFEGDLAVGLAKLRESLGMTQRALAEACGIKQPMIARLERAGQVPTATTLWKLARGFRRSSRSLPTESR